jgi:hypothetical protein
LPNRVARPTSKRWQGEALTDPGKAFFFLE